jgi:hypothetical protein
MHRVKCRALKAATKGVFVSGCHPPFQMRPYVPGSYYFFLFILGKRHYLLELSVAARLKQKADFGY